MNKIEIDEIDEIDVAGVRRAHHLQKISLIGFLSRDEPTTWPEEIVAFVVQLAREDFYGPTWSEIAAALGLSRDACVERFHGTVQLRLA